MPRLLGSGYRVRVLVRDPARLQGRTWLDKVELVTGDALLPETLAAAFKDISVSYYLIHGKQSGQLNGDFACVSCLLKTTARRQRASN